MKYFIITLLVALAALAGGYWYWQQSGNQPSGAVPETVAPSEASTASSTNAQASPALTSGEEVIGKSIENRDIVAYHFLPGQAGGSGDKEVLFVGGIHGGYEWNTTLVANNLIEYLRENPNAVPQGVKVTVIPVLNPDGLAKVVDDATSFTAADITASAGEQVAGRFNANNVDLNRNFDCDWQKSGTWQNKTVSGGSKVFSEPESRALREYVESHDITAALVWYSQAGGVFASACHDGVLPETTKLTSIFASASGYPAHESFDFYAITGDAVNWLAKQKVPAISVLLTTHTDIEWDKNLKGVQALLAHVAE